MNTAPTWTININLPLIDSKAEYFTLNSWPPSDDFPVVTDGAGKVISRFADSTWILTYWTTTSTTLNFGDGKELNGVLNSTENALFFRILTAWWLWRSPTPITVTTIKTYHSVFAPVFSICSANNIPITDLRHHPKIIDLLISKLKPRALNRLTFHLHSIYENREEIGFYVLNPSQIEILNSRIEQFNAKQTPYIPPRIWRYQVMRLREFIDDFLSIESELQECLSDCIDLYIGHFGSIDTSFSRLQNKAGLPGPFTKNPEVTFEQFADTRGIGDTLRKWLVAPGESLNGHGKGITLLASFNSLASRIGIAYILNFTAMRINEAWTLRSDCLRCEVDPTFGTFWTIAGETTKLFADSDARWVTSSSVQVAIRVLTVVARFRLKLAKLNPNTPSPDAREDDNPYLVYRPYEPWATRKNESLPTSIRPHYASYGSIVEGYPYLFSKEAITITNDDFRIAKLITPTLNDLRYSAGKPWPFSWHQLRRTGAVNMQASGLVSELSLQYDLKHLSRLQSLYYAQGFSKLLFNEDARSEYVKAMYETRALYTSRLVTDRFSSPHGEKHKAAILAPYTNKDLRALAASAAEGEVPFREVVLGVCLNKGFCPYGGIDNIIRCGGGDGKDACANLLYDTQKLIPIMELRAEIRLRQKLAVPASPYAAALEAQLLSADAAINKIQLKPVS
jgi:hypothetical protein